MRFTLLVLLSAALCHAQAGEKLAPYVPTPETIVEKMLQLADVKPGDRVMDIGSGDGRIVILAAQRFRAEAYGIEIDHSLVTKSRERIATLGLDKNAKIIEGDALQHDYASYDVVTVYLWPSSNIRLRPLLDKQLRPGTRVVAHDFPVQGWRAEREVLVEDDGTGRSHTLYLYRIPRSPK